MIVIDTAGDVQAQMALLKSKDVRAVARHYAIDADKGLQRAEAEAISAAGLEIVAVFAGEGALTRGFEQGVHDGQLALLQATRVVQPAGSTIYFALEPASADGEDVHDDSDAGSDVSAYVVGLREVLSQWYKVGVIGSAAQCEPLQRNGACDDVWLVGPATPGSGLRAALVQREADADWDGLKVSISEAADDIGSFTVRAEADAEPERAQLATPDFAVLEATSPADAMTTPDGYRPPQASHAPLDGVPFDRAVRVGDTFTARFNAFDQTPKGKIDPSRCKGLYRLPGDVLFWESKMAVDADGSPAPSVLHSSSGSNEHTSLTFAHSSHGRNAVNAEIVPYVVLPKDDFIAELEIPLGVLAIVVFQNRIAGAIFADEGPVKKIGEASIRVHELVRPAPAPWKGDPANKVLRDASVESGVCYFIFPHARFDINAFGPDRQAEMAVSIHAAAMAEFNRLKTAPPAPHVALAPMEAVTEAVVAETSVAEAAVAAASPRLALAGNWEALLNALNGATDATVALYAEQLPFALAAIPKLRQRTKGPLMIGFDADQIESRTFARAVDLATSLGAGLAVRVDGPGGPTLGTWRAGDKRRLRARAATVVPEVRVDDGNFQRVLDLWDSGAWWTFTRRQLAAFRQRGFTACVIDNLTRALDRFPSSFGATGDGGATAALLGFLADYAKAHAAGELPDLILSQCDDTALDQIKAAITAGTLPRTMFAGFLIVADGGSTDPTRQQQLAAGLGLQTVRDGTFVMGP